MACDEHVVVFNDLIELQSKYGVRLIGSVSFARYLSLRARQLGLDIADNNPVYMAVLKRGGDTTLRGNMMKLETCLAGGELQSARSLVRDYKWICLTKRPVWRQRG